MNQPDDNDTSGQFAASASSASKRSLIRRILFPTVLGGSVALIGTGVGVAFFVMAQLSHPPEDTANFLPANTAMYFSLNMRPGADQLLKFRDMMTRFQENPNFQRLIDEGFDNIRDESGFDLREDFLPWIGPELAFALIDFGDLESGDVEAVAFLGTSDSAASQAFVDDLVDYLENEEALEFNQETYRGFATYRGEDPFDGPNLDIAVTDAYVVFATGQSLLDTTLDRMIDRTEASLANSESFQWARSVAEDPRFSLLYMDVDGMMTNVRRNLDLFEQEALLRLENGIPTRISSSGTFIDMGIKFSVTYETPEESLVFENSTPLSAARLLPQDTLALLSFTGIREAWGQIEESLDELASEPLYGMTNPLPDFELQTGLDIEQDIIGWMSGEMALALLPSDFPLDFSGEVEEAIIHAVGLIGFTERAQVEDALDNIVSVLEEEGLTFRDAVVGGEDALLLDLEDLAGSGYEPGYSILGNYVALGTTRESLEQLADVSGGRLPSLADAPEYSRLIGEAGEDMDIILYANLRELVETFIRVLSPSELSEYEDYAAPFVEPVQALFMGGKVNADISTSVAILTFE